MGTPGSIIVADGVGITWRGTAGDDAFDGTSTSENFYGGLGDDVLFAGGGNDYVVADLGNDWLDGGDGVDALSFTYANYSGSHGVTASYGITFDMEKPKQDMGYFGVKSIYGFEDVFGTFKADKLSGDDNDNEFVTYAGADRLDGRGGDDTLRGGVDSDTLIGGDGDDYLQGDEGLDRLFSGLGRDTLSGGAGTSSFDDGAKDYFIYSSVKYSGTTDATRDTIYGHFVGSNGDKIDLSDIDANGSRSGDGKFTFVGANSFHSNSTSEVQVRATGNANEYMVKVDTDSDNGSEMQILVHSATALTASDFIL